MPLVRMLISSLPTISSPASDAIDNTLYFNVSGSIDDPDYNNLTTDLMTIWAARPWSLGRFLDIRAYNMDDPKPRPVKSRKTQAVAGTGPAGPGQIAVALSYYADRNLPRQRGRIFTGPWAPQTKNVQPTQVASVLALAPLLAGLGGLNVDWSLWSPTTQTHTRINHAWADDSWDVIRSRKIPASAARMEWTGDG